MPTPPSRDDEAPPLEPAARVPPSSAWWVRHPAGLACFVFGVISIGIAAALQMKQDALFEHIPDPRLTIPLWFVAAVAGAISVIRREGNYGLVVAGAALASAALALGWVLVLAAVAAGALIVIYVMSELF
jgi:hypothetical protein